MNKNKNVTKKSHGMELKYCLWKMYDFNEYIRETTC